MSCRKPTSTSLPPLVVGGVDDQPADHAGDQRGGDDQGDDVDRVLPPRQHDDVVVVVASSAVVDDARAPPVRRPSVRRARPHRPPQQCASRIRPAGTSRSTPVRRRPTLGSVRRWPARRRYRTPDGDPRRSAAGPATRTRPTRGRASSTWPWSCSPATGTRPRRTARSPRRAGSPAPAIYHYFASKAELYAAVYEVGRSTACSREFEKAIVDHHTPGRASTPPCSTPRRELNRADPTLPAFVVGVASDAQRHPELEPMLRPLRRRTTAFFRRLVAAAAERGELSAGRRPAGRRGPAQRRRLRAGPAVGGDRRCPPPRRGRRRAAAVLRRDADRRAESRSAGGGGRRCTARCGSHRRRHRRRQLTRIDVSPGDLGVERRTVAPSEPVAVHVNVVPTSVDAGSVHSASVNVSPLLGASVAVVVLDELLGLAPGSRRSSGRRHRRRAELGEHGGERRRREDLETAAHAPAG